MRLRVGGSGWAIAFPVYVLGMFAAVSLGQACSEHMLFGLFVVTAVWMVELIRQERALDRRVLPRMKVWRVR